MIQLTENPIDYHQLTESVRDHRAGAVVLFLGTVREFTGDVQTTFLRYEAFPEMAQHQLQALEAECRQRFTVLNVAVSHRVGKLELGEVSVAVAVSSPHRAQAFEAGRWLIDTLKERVPVWKQDNFPDGRSEWVHPGITEGSKAGMPHSAAEARTLSSEESRESR